METALNIAKYMINKCINDICPISNLQVQKIMYYIQREFLQKYDRPLFEDDFQAWQFGPVLENTYYELCPYGGMKIEDKFDIEVNLCDDDKKIIDEIIESKRILNPWDLVEATHNSGGAWDLTYKNGAGNKDIISKELIKTNG